jgi:hypothetical protein
MPISGKPEIGVCSAPLRAARFVLRCARDTRRCIALVHPLTSSARAAAWTHYSPNT